MTPNEFISWLAPMAQTSCRKYNLPASVLIAQGALESGWGRYVIGEYNLFGRKWGGWGNYIEVPTTEYYDGNEVHIIDKFQDYDSLEQACDDWCILMREEPVYDGAEQIWYATQDIEQFVTTMGPVYATDPDYADKILATIRSCDLTQFDA